MNYTIPKITQEEYTKKDIQIKENCIETVKQIAPNSKVDFCTGCFSGIYPGKIYSE